MNVISKDLGAFSLELWKATFGGYQNFRMENETANHKEIPTYLLIGVQFDYGESLSSARVLRVWHSSFDYFTVRC